MLGLIKRHLILSDLLSSAQLHHPMSVRHASEAALLSADWTMAVLHQPIPSHNLLCAGRCVAMLASLFHAPEPGLGKAVGTAAIGSSEAILLGGLAMKKRWEARQKAANKPFDKPNLVMGSNVQVRFLPPVCESSSGVRLDGSLSPIIPGLRVAANGRTRLPGSEAWGLCRSHVEHSALSLAGRGDQPCWDYHHLLAASLQLPAMLLQCQGPCRAMDIHLFHGQWHQDIKSCAGVLGKVHTLF